MSTQGPNTESTPDAAPGDTPAHVSDAPPAPLSDEDRARVDEQAAARQERLDALPDAVKARMEAPFYCPGCGRPFQYEGECTGASAGAPHPPIQTVSTDELHGDDTDAHTAAPSTEGT